MALAAVAMAPALASAQPAPPEETPETPKDEKGEKGERGDTGEGDKKPTGDLELAKKYYLEAHKQHTEGQYDAAAENYLKAYDAYPKSAFIYNAAQVYRLGGRAAKALEHYKRYLELDPEGDGAARAKEFIPALEKAIAEANQTGGVTGDPLGKPDGGGGENGGTGETGDGDTRVVVGVNDAAEPLPVVNRDSIEGVGRGRRIAGLVLVGVGAAMIGGGVGFALHARSLSDEASDFNGPAGPELDDLYDRGEAADRNMVLMLSAGALTAAAGGVVYYLGVRSRGLAERDLELFIAPTGAGISGTF